MDEAQDNSPKQWEIIRLLTQDFVSGESARAELNRTIFAVGEKNSQYTHFKVQIQIPLIVCKNIFLLPWVLSVRNIQPLNLFHSFRSSKPILNLVDASFKDSFFERINDQPSHLAIKAFKLLMNVHGVENYKACATSAMREASNGQKIAEKIHQKTGIKINIISGKEEAEIISSTDLHELISGDKSYLYVDVGGGSTEFTNSRNRSTRPYERAWS